MELGPAGQTVAANLRRLREARGLSLRALSAETQKVGRPLSADALNKIENARPPKPGDQPPKQVRRVDSDDLTGLALALNVSPLALLLPPEWGPGRVKLTPEFELSARSAWLWAEGRAPADDWATEDVVSVEDDDEKEADYFKKREEYEALTHPPGRRRAAQHPANAAAEAVSTMVSRLVRAAEGGKREAVARQLRITQNQLAQLQNVIEQIELELDDE